MWEGRGIQMKKQTCKQTNTFVNSDVSETDFFLLDVFNHFYFHCII